MNQFFAAGSFVFHIIALQGHHVYLAGILLVRIGNLLYHNCPRGKDTRDSDMCKALCQREQKAEFASFSGLASDTQLCVMIFRTVLYN